MTLMTAANRNLRYGLGISAFIVGFLWLFNDILMPFVAGLLIAYLLNPFVNRLAHRGLPRGFAAAFIFVLFVCVIATAAAVLFPLLREQVSQITLLLPEYLAKFKNAISIWMERFYWRFSGGEEAPDIKEIAGNYATEAFSWTGDLVKGIWKGGLAIFDIITLLLITPVVTFYLLRDWPKLFQGVYKLIPRRYADTFHDLLKQIDDVVSSFLHGQAIVCLFLGSFYALGLLLLGVNFGLLIGLLSGLLSIIPYVGTISGFIAATAVAYFQSDGFVLPGYVAAVFAFGQFVEGNFLTPKLVGDRVGLHAVWVLFALMAGGSLLGFTGVMLAVPVAACIGVLARFWLKKYQESDFFRDQGKKKKSHAAT